MARNLRLALLTATAALALTAIPPLLSAPMTAGLSTSALAASNLNSSRSNVYRTTAPGNTKQPAGRTKSTGNTTSGNKWPGATLNH
jgi:hypothetical protein